MIYQNSVCINNKDQLPLSGSPAPTFVVTLEYCTNFPNKKSKCLGEEETNKFLNENFVYVLMLDNVVDKHYFESNLEYFPIQTGVIETYGDNIPIMQQDSKFNLIEVVLQKDEVTIDDSFIW